MRTLIAVKRTKWERDNIRYGSEETVRRLYKIQNNSIGHIFESHERQTRCVDRLREQLPDARYVRREDLPQLDLCLFDRVISLGGDNHFIFVSCFVRDNVPLIGINSDPTTSRGALLYFNSETFLEKGLARIVPSRYLTERWTRIGCSLEYPGGKRRVTNPCTSEISIRNVFPDFTSRYIIRKQGGEWEEQKSSGLLLSTGAGSTGWYRNCHQTLSTADVVFPKDAPYFRVVARELGGQRKYRYQQLEVRVGEVLEVISEMDGAISIDAHPENTYDFPPGCIARFSRSESELHVVRDIREQ